MKGFGIFYKKVKQYFQKIVYQKFEPQFLKNFVLAYYFYVIGGGMIFCISGKKKLISYTRNGLFPKKIIYENFRPNFRKNLIFAYSSIIDSKMIVGLPCEST